jgi:hypothetical protein
MNLTQRQRLLAIIAIAVVALLAGDKLLIGPLIKSWQARSERLTALRKEVEEGRSLQGRAKSIRDRWDTMRKATLSPETSVAENQVLKAFDRWSQESRVGISSLKPQWKRGGTAEYATLDCRVDATGNLNALTRLLYNIENARRVDRDPLAIKIEVLELSTRNDSGDQLTLGLQVSALQLNPPAKR